MRVTGVEMEGSRKNLEYVSDVESTGLIDRS